MDFLQETEIYFDVATHGGLLVEFVEIMTRVVNTNTNNGEGERIAAVARVVNPNTNNGEEARTRNIEKIIGLLKKNNGPST